MKCWSVLLIAFLSFSSAALLEPALVEQMARCDGDEKLPVIIALNEQLDAENIIRTIKNKQQRWEVTVSRLKQMAETGQAGLLAELRSFEAAGKVAEIVPMWIVNAVYCEATPEVIQKIAERPEIWLIQWDKIASPNILNVAPATAAGDVTAGSFTVEWNVKKVKADSVWYVYGYTGEGVVIGNIDTGCDYNHSDLASHMWTDPNYPYHGWNFEQNNNNPMDQHGHGTHTCGTNAGDGTAGDTTGMAPKAKIMTCRTKTSLNPPLPDTIAENTVMRSMEFCVAPPLSPHNHAHVLSMSLGWVPSWNPRRSLWRHCVTNVAAAGLAYFIANGNEGASNPPYNVRCPGDVPGPWKHPAEPPGGLGGAISIGATDANDNIASFSSWGPVSWDTVHPYLDYPYPPGLFKPDFSAPGVNVTSTRLGGGYTQMSGTSMATPCAAGIAALMLERNPNLLPEEVSEIMQNSVLPLGTQPKNNTYGTGRIDAMLCIQNTPLPGAMHDVAMGTVLAPADKIEPRTPLAPQVTVRNRGTFAEPNVVVYCKVESLGTVIYNENVTIPLLDSAATDTVTFPNWNVGPGSQTYNLTFWHYHVPDTNRRNDTCRKTTVTRGHDVITTSGIGARVRAMTPLYPRINLTSTDYTERNFKAHCRVESAGTRIYRDSVLVDSVPAGGTRSFTFPTAWNVGAAGTSYNVRMWHSCVPDENRSNDTARVVTTATDQIRVLWLYSDFDAPDTTLGVRLRELGDSVEYMDVQSTTPTLSQLLPYDAVGAHSNYPFADPTALGNVLADYVDAGGGVVIGNFGFTVGWAMGGRIMTGNYATISPGSNTHSPTSLGWFNPGHPVMAGVDSVREYYCASGAFAAESVARWQDGRPYVAVAANQKVVGVNSYPGTYSVPDRGAQWALVFHNALLYVAGGGQGTEEFDPFGPALNVELTALPSLPQQRAVLSFAALAGTPVSLAIYDLNGRLVRNVFSGVSGSNVQRHVWDLTDSDGQRVAGGVYFCQLTAGDRTVSRKLVVR